MISTSFCHGNACLFAIALFTISVRSTLPTLALKRPTLVRKSAIGGPPPRPRTSALPIGAFLTAFPPLLLDFLHVCELFD